MRSRAWMDVFSSTLRTIACSGGWRYRPTTSVTLAANCGSRLTLYVRVRCGLTPWARRTSDTQPLVNPTAWPKRRVVHRLRPAGGGRHGELYDLFDGLGRHRMVPATGLGAVAQPVHALPDKPSPDPRHRFWRQLETRRDVHAGFPRRAQQNDAGAAHQPRGLPCSRHQRFQHLLLFPCRADLVCVRHTRIRSHT